MTTAVAPTPVPPPTTALSEQVLARLDRLEAAVERLASALEAANGCRVSLSGYKHLEYRPHAWRRQPYLRGITMTVLQLVATLRVNRWAPEQAAEQYGLPVEAVKEALDFAERHKELIDYEVQYERYLLEKGGVSFGPPVVPG